MSRPEKTFFSLAAVPAVWRWAILILVSAPLVVILEAARLPAALLLGPMLAGILLGAADGAVKMPGLVFALAQGGIGCMIARSITPSTLGEIGRDWPLFLVGVVAVIVASNGLGWLLARRQVLPGTSAVWASSPGAATAMVLMAEAYGADVRLVAFMQYLRVVVIAVVASTVARLSVDPAAIGPATASVWFPPIDAVPVAVTVGFAVLCVLVALRLRIPAGALMLPVFGGVALQGAGVMTIDMPPWLLAVSYALVGWNIGLRFNRPVLVHAAKALPRVLSSILALVVICGAFAMLLVVAAGIDPLTAYLATSPGGVDSVAIIAASSHVDLPFVMAMQTARFVLVLITGPSIARFIARRLRLVDTPA